MSTVKPMPEPTAGAAVAPGSTKGAEPAARTSSATEPAARTSSATEPAARTSSATEPAARLPRRVQTVRSGVGAARPTVLARATSRATAAARRRAEAETRRFWETMREQRIDAGLSQAAIARAAGMSTTYLSTLEDGKGRPSLEICARVAAVLGGEVGLRFFAGTGPLLRDHLQAAMIEALLRVVDRRWRRRLEVPVMQPVRGYIDLVLDDPARALSVATEVQSDLRRVEQQLRWAEAKAAALIPPTPANDLAPGFDPSTSMVDPSTSMFDPSTPMDGPDPAVEGSGGRRVDWTRSRLLILRSTSRTLKIVGIHPELFRAAYPADAEAAFGALTGPDVPWPGSALLWVRIEGGVGQLLPRPPRGIRVGR